MFVNMVKVLTLLLCFYTIPILISAQSTDIVSNKKIFEAFVEKKSSQIVEDFTVISKRFRPIQSDDLSVSIVYSELIDKNVIFNDSSLYEIRVSPKFSSSIIWSGKGERYNREVVISMSVQILDTARVIDSRSYFEVYTDEIPKSHIDSVQTLGFMFSNNVENERMKNAKKRILEPSVVLLGIMSTAYLLFTLRL